MSTAIPSGAAPERSENTPTTWGRRSSSMTPPTPSPSTSSPSNSAPIEAESAVIRIVLQASGAATASVGADAMRTFLLRTSTVGPAPLTVRARAPAVSPASLGAGHPRTRSPAPLELGADRGGVGRDPDRAAGIRRGDGVRRGRRDEDVPAAHLDRGAGDADREGASARVLARLLGGGRHEHAVLGALVTQLLHRRAGDLHGEIERVVRHERSGDRVERAALRPADRRRGLGDRQQRDQDREDDADQAADRGDDPPTVP